MKWSGLEEEGEGFSKKGEKNGGMVLDIGTISAFV